MLHPLLEKYIPSRSYVEFLKAQDAAFTDFETAAILGHIFTLLFEERLSIWRSLLEETKDGELKRQLAEEIALEQKALELFRTKKDGAVYMICGGDGDPVGLAENYETAYAIALASEKDFEIEKYELLAKYRELTLEDIQRMRALAPDDSPGCIPEEVINPIGLARYNKQGTLLSVWSEEVDAQVLKRHCSPANFTHAYVEYPYPFERGDVVRYVSRRRATCDSLPGIIATSPADWAKTQERLRSEPYADVLEIDGSCRIEWLQAEGDFSVDNVPPIFLERYEPEKEQPWYDMLQEGSRLMKGEGSLEWYTHYYKTYQEQRKAETLGKQLSRWQKRQEMIDEADMM